MERIHQETSGDESLPESERREEHEGKISKLREFIRRAAAETREKDGVPVDDNGRINIDAYNNVYSDVARDKQLTEEWLKEWYPGATAEERERKRMLTDGERLEELTFAIFYKNLSKDFIIARTSPHDDRANKVDTLIIERKTGNVVCAFDEVGATSGLEFEVKRAGVSDRNIRHQGANVKYGIRVRNEGGAPKISLGGIEHIPIFYIPLPKDRIEKGIADFNPSPDEQSDFETKLFEYFVAIMDAQAKGLNLSRERLDETLRDRLAAFMKTLEGIRSRIQQPQGRPPGWSSSAASASRRPGRRSW